MPDDDLTPVQVELLARLEDHSGPFSTREAIDHLDARHGDFLDRHRSARHRTWMHTALNDLVAAGKLTRSESNNRVRYRLK
jgi:hypothetical protein